MAAYIRRMFIQCNFLKRRTRTAILQRSFTSHGFRNSTFIHEAKKFKNYWPYVGLMVGGTLGYGVYKFTPNILSTINTTISAIAPRVNARTTPDDNLPPSRRFNFIADAVETVEGAVVYIEVTDGRVTGFWGHHAGPTSSGSGFFVSEDGLVLTNAHVVANAINVTVKLGDGRQYKGVVVDIDPIKDLAAIRLHASQVSMMMMMMVNDNDEKIDR